MSAPEKPPVSRLFSLTVFVAALGNFVDVFDVLLFPIVRQPSLTVGLACIALALVSLRGMAETAGRDLDFVE